MVPRPTVLRSVIFKLIISDKKANIKSKKMFKNPLILLGLRYATKASRNMAIINMKGKELSMPHVLLAIPLTGTKSVFEAVCGKGKALKNPKNLNASMPPMKNIITISIR